MDETGNKKLRTGVVAVVGRTNVGKSTLLNALVGEKVSIVSDTVQTTRNIIRAILTEERGQIVFLDTPGVAQQTGRTLDAMTTGNSWFAVQGLDGNEAYTRAGSFQVAADGTLQTNSGLSVLSSGGSPITVPPGAAVSLSNDGSISAKVGNQPLSVLGKLKQVTPTSDDPLKRGDDGLFRSTSGDPLNNDDAARLHVGVLEGSNVNAIETMVGMIQTARQFEAQTKLMTTAEANDRSAAQLLGVQ